MDIRALRPIFEENNIIIDLPKVNEKLLEEELLKIIDRYDGVICGDDCFTPEVLNKAKKLKVIVKWGTGVDSINIEYAKKLNIPVYNTPKAFTEPVADTVMGLILVFARNILETNKLMKQSKWSKIRNVSLSEKTLGIIGVGNNGQAVAERAHSFGMKILGNDTRKISRKITEKYNISIVDKNTLFAKADYISLNCTLNKTSYHLLGKKEFQIMKESAILINTARGSIINEDDLIWALKNKQIAGAGLDVFEKEPLSPQSLLMNFDNVILSPHTANSSSYYWFKVHKSSIKKLLQGLNMKNK